MRYGETMVFTCRVTGDPTPKIKWMKEKGASHSDDDSGKTVIREDGVKYVIHEDGTLVIKGTTMEDTGMYECVASSDMGSTRSRRAVAAVVAVPNFSPVHELSEKPVSRNLTAGADVTLGCPARDGLWVRWFRNGSPISYGGRISHRNEENDVLRIFAVKESDAGRYECRVGRDSHMEHFFTDLYVASIESSYRDSFAVPRLIVKPQDMEAELDATVEIPCRAEGAPRPVIQWKKDGSAIESSRLKITRGGSLLIYNVSPQDTGR